MKLYNYEIETLKYLIPYLRQNQDIGNLLKAIGERFNNLQDSISFLADQLTIANAKGVWLDYIGVEVGTTRDEVDFGDFFLVNAPHINIAKRFYITTSKDNPSETITLDDAEFIQKIMSVIGSNISCGTRNENLNLIKTITNSNNVIIKKVGTALLDIYLYSDNLVYTSNTVNYIENVIGNGIFINEVHINE